jgi:hypothetical protein
MILRILAGALTGTTLMTVASYYRSRRGNKEFREPVLLNKLLYSSCGEENVENNPLPGWVLHFGMGYFFVSLYHMIWKKTGMNAEIRSTTILGLLNGFVGTAGWHLLFRSHPCPPSVDIRSFYLHLIAVHVLFAWGAVTGYKIIPPPRSGRKKA